MATNNPVDPMAGEVLGQSSSLSPWAGPYVTQMLGKGAALANMGYTPYRGPLTAGPSALQRQAFQGLAGLAVPFANRVGSFAGSMPSYGGMQARQSPQGMQVPPGMAMDNIPGLQASQGQQLPPGVATTNIPGLQASQGPQLPPGVATTNIPGLQASQGPSTMGGPASEFQPGGRFGGPGQPADMNALRQEFLGGRKGPPGMTDAMRKELIESVGAQKPDATNMPVGGTNAPFMPRVVRTAAGDALEKSFEKWREANPNASQEESMNWILQNQPQGPQQGNLGYEGPVTDMGNGMATQVMGMQAPQAPQAPQGPQGPQSVAQQYMNPYIDAALQPQMEEARRQAQIEQQNLQSRYGRAGAYGGGRQAVAEAELSGALQRNLANIYGTGMEKAYDKAADMFNQERQYGLQALQQQLAGGAQQRGIESEGIAADKAQFEQERDYPYKQVQFMQSLLQGLPIQTQSYQYAEPSGLGQFMGGASGIAAILDMLRGG